MALAIVAIHTALIGWGAFRQSPNSNEAAHLIAGISYWDFGRFDIYRVNPPLTRLVAAIPAIAASPKTDWKGFDERPGARPEFQMGQDFLAANGERSLWLCTIARWACIPFSWCGAWICFRWASDLYGPSSGLLATALWCFEPNILAHSELLTPDAGAAALGLAAGYSFWSWLKTPTWSAALVAGVVLGLAEVTKFTWLILFLLWPALWVFWRLTESSSRGKFKCWTREGGQLGIALVLGIYTINFAYLFDGTCQPLGAFKFVSDSLAKTSVIDGRLIGEPGTNRFAETMVGRLPVPLPKDFVLGVDAQKKDFEHFGGKSYLRGEFRDRGWWYYYLYASIVKIPIGVWILSLLALFTPSDRNSQSRSWRRTIPVITPIVLVALLISSQTGLNCHFRYALPAFGFVFIAISRVALAFRTTGVLHKAVTMFALTWAIASSLWIYPHSLSYFNEFVGGPNSGAAHLLETNVDWGQDLIYLKQWIDKHPDVAPVNLVYYGELDPGWFGVKYRFPRQFGSPHVSWSDKPMTPDGWYAISVSFLYGAHAIAPVGNGKWHWFSGDEFDEFRRRQPDAQAGYSLWLFHVDSPHRR